MSSQVEIISAEEFERLVEKHALGSEKMIEACRLVFVDGVSRNQAGLAVGVNYASLHRTVRKLQGYCPHCGQALPTKEA